MNQIESDIMGLKAQTHATSDALENLATDFRNIVDGLHSREDGDAITRGRVNALEDLLKPAAPDRTEIYTALAAAQLEISNAQVNTDNEFTGKKYANLAAVLDAVRKPLAENGIAIFQITEDPEQAGWLGMRTILAHTSGQTIQDVITMQPPKQDPQGIGSCRTYMRRYSLLALCGIAGADDDDAEGTKEDPNAYPRITTTQAEKILIKADELFGERADAVLAKMLNRLFGGIQNVGDIREGEADAAMTNLANAKKLMDKNEADAKKKEAAEKKAAKEKV